MTFSETNSTEYYPIHVGDVNYHYYDLLHSYPQFAERGVQGLEDLDCKQFKIITEATLQLALNRKLGQSWDEVLAANPGYQRVSDEGAYWIIDRNGAQSSSDETHPNEVKLTQAEWLTGKSYLPMTPFNTCYAWQPNLDLYPEDEWFNLFFLLKLRRLRPSQVSSFLEAYFAESADQDIQLFERDVRKRLADYEAFFPLSTPIENEKDNWFQDQKQASEAEIALDLASSANYASKAQQVVIMLILDAEYNFIKKRAGSETTDCARFISFLTGKDLTKTRGFITRFKKNHDIVHATKKQNLEDYNRVRLLFLELGNQNITNRIDDIINEIISLKE